MTHSPLPEPITSEYPMAEPNEQIQLYVGPIELAQQQNTARGDGTLSLRWLPFPNLEFEVSPIGPPYSFDLGVIQLSLSSIQASVPASLNRMQLLGDQHFSGSPVEPIILGSGDQLKYVKFHLTNFHEFVGEPVRSVSEKGEGYWKGRMILEADGWKIVVDSLRDLHDLVGRVETLNGYATTHIGRLERSDGTSFNSKEASDLLDALFYFFSFARGFWSAPMLPVGFDETNDVVWRVWGIYKLSPWKYVDSWFPVMDIRGITNLFAGFLSRWRNPLWNEPLRVAIDLYVQTNYQFGSLEGSIVLEQIALELVAWVRLVEEAHTISTSGFEQLPAADKLRLLISESGIPLQTPSSLSTLAAASAHKAWSIGPFALTEIRNGIVHPKKRRKVSALSTSQKYEAWKLGLWYLELVILRLFSYEGNYANRLPQDRWRGQSEPVPWLE